MDPLFPAIPENLGGLTDDELVALEQASLEVVRAVKARNADVIGERSDQELAQEVTEGVAGLERIRAEQAGRRDAAAAAEASIEEALASVLEPDEPEGKATPADGADEAQEAAEEPAEVPAEEVEVVTAATRGYARQLPAPSPDHEPAPPAPRPAGAIIVASGEGGLERGRECSSLDLARAMIEARRHMGNLATPEGAEFRHVMASVRARYPDDRVLPEAEESGVETWNRIQAVIGGPPGSQRQVKALAASGGLCAPVNPYYNLLLLAEAATPVIDSLPVFNASRGGIRYMSPIGISSVSANATGAITAANDKLGGTNATKNCATISCPSVNEVDVAAIYHCVQYGNMPTRAWPEQIDNYNSLVAAALASLRETRTLNTIKSNSTAATLPAIGGTNATLFPGLILAAVGLRSRHRMDPMTPMRVLMPYWVRDELVSDILRGQFQRFDGSFESMDALFRRYNLNPVYYWDSATSGNQVFGSQSAGVLNGYPSAAQIYMYPEGSFIHLDMGSLELGLVRDSTLNSTNDYRIFGETFEETAFLGIESLLITVTMCDTGATSGTVTVTCGS
jgi:hypothetical protein